MNEILEELKGWGCDIDAAMERFFGNTAFYSSCLKKVVTERSFQTLGEALLEQNLKEAFESAHTLKGVLANMSLTPMFRIADGITETLRGGTMDGVMAEYQKLLEEKAYLEELLKRNGD